MMMSIFLLLWKVFVADSPRVYSNAKHKITVLISWLMLIKDLQCVCCLV